MIDILNLKNFKLFKKEEILLSKINIIKGINKDDIESSSNGSGKSSILEGIIFSLFGDGSGKNLQDLISFDSKSTEVILQGTDFEIKRRVPTDLDFIYKGDTIQKNTNTLKQEEINKLYGDYNFFKKYRLINKQAVNLLDLGLISLRKELMSFINTDFSYIRQNLLDEKCNREKYSTDKRPYKYYLSTKRKCLLESGHLKLVDIIKDLQEKIDKQVSILNHTTISIQSNEMQLINCDNGKLKTQLIEWNKEIDNYTNLIKELNKIEIITLVDYDVLIKELQEKIESIEIDIDYLNNEISNKQTESSDTNSLLITVKNKAKDTEKRIFRLEEEIKDIKSSNSKSKCDKCGSIIEESKKTIFIKEKEQEITKEIEIARKIESDIDTIIKHQNNIHEELNKLVVENKNSKQQLNGFQNELKNLNEKKCEQLKQQEKISLKEADIKKYKELIDTAKKQIEKLNLQIEENNKSIKQINEDEISLRKQLTKEKDILDELYKKQDILETKEKKTSQYLMKLTEAFKFSEYKYTLKDIELYNSSIKVVDEFSGWFIQKWLDNLAIVINNLLEKLNLSVTFSSDKQFLTIVNQGQSMKYESLSSGQQCFLNCIFKIAILLNNGINDGVLMFDEGINTLDKINLKKLIDVLKDLQFQTFLIYQNYDLEEDVNIITVKRENGVSNVQR